MEGDLASDQVLRASPVPSITRRRSNIALITACEDSPIKEARQGRLYNSKGIEINLPTRNPKKDLESVIAKRISYVVEIYGLLSTNHFSARKQRLAEQALLLLQEEIYTV